MKLSISSAFFNPPSFSFFLDSSIVIKYFVELMLLLIPGDIEVTRRSRYFFRAIFFLTAHCGSRVNAIAYDKFAKGSKELEEWTVDGHKILVLLPPRWQFYPLVCRFVCETLLRGSCTAIMLSNETHLAHR